MKKKVAVIGGGPAGIIASGFSSSKGNEVTLFEKNEKIGKKLFITGKGRCNITNASPIEDLIESISKNKSFMYSSFYSFTNDNIIELLESYGTKVKIERGNRVFPLSNKSSDVIKSFIRFLKENNVELRLNTKIKSIEKEKGKFKVISDNIEYFDSVIITTGGKSYPSTGSSGDGYIFAKKLGHNVTRLTPSLVPIELYDNWVKDLQGLSLKNVSIKAYNMSKLIYSELGEMIFTHYGISGPIVLRTSNYINNYNKKDIHIEIDLKPGLDDVQLEKRLLRDFEKYSKKAIKNSLGDLLPNRIIPIIIEKSKIEEKKIVNQLTKIERKNLIESIKKLRLKFKGFRPIEEAIVTSGGVSTEEIDPSTMESKIVENLYFAGEVIDVDALTGGYNLQIAYSTGYLAGINS